MRFNDRREAGRLLAERLKDYTGRSDVVVLALPRGGVPVAYEVAQRLRVPLDIFLVRKLGVPGHPELAMGAIAQGGVEVLSDDLIRDLGVPIALVRQVAAREKLELDRRDRQYRGGRSLAPVRDRVVILIDDGLATGSTMQAAATALRQLSPARIIVAAPVGAGETCARLKQFADAVVCLETPEPFQAVGLWYEHFDQTSDEEVRRLLEGMSGGRKPQDDAHTATEVRVPVGAQALVGDLRVPPSARGVVLFAHGSGSSRHSSRNQHVARVLEGEGFATLLIDLLTMEEERVDQYTGHLRFDIEMLAARLVAIVDWLGRRDGVAALPIGLFGASTGGGAALMASAVRPEPIAAIVSRGGRPDLAGRALPRVTAPTLLIVGGRDTAVIAMNRDAMSQMRCEVSLEIVDGATHLFEESGALERVAALAADWFARHLTAAAGDRRSHQSA